MSVITITMGQGGTIHFPPHNDPRKLELIQGERSVLQRLIEAHAAPGPMPGTWVVPGMADAQDTDEAMEIYRRFRERLAYQLCAITAPAPPPAPSPPPNLEKELERQLIDLYRGALQRQDMQQLVGVKVLVIKALMERIMAADLAARRAA